MDTTVQKTKSFGDKIGAVVAAPIAVFWFFYVFIILNFSQLDNLDIPSYWDKLIFGMIVIGELVFVLMTALLVISIRKKSRVLTSISASIVILVYLFVFWLMFEQHLLQFLASRIPHLYYYP